MEMAGCVASAGRQEPILDGMVLPRFRYAGIGFSI